MTPEKEILDFKGQVRFLETMASEVGDFSPWLEKALNGDYRPFYLGQTDLVVRLVDIYRATGIGLRQAFRTSVARLVCSWNESFDNKSYLGLLLYMSGRLRVVDSYEIILAWARKRRFVGQFARSEDKARGSDLHLACLQAIGAQGTEDPRFRDLCIRDIEERAYFGVCYWTLSEMEFEYVKTYFQKFIQSCIEGRYEFHNHFYLIEKLYWKEFCNNCDDLSKMLSLPERAFLYKMLRDSAKVVIPRNHSDLVQDSLSELYNHATGRLFAPGDKREDPEAGLVLTILHGGYEGGLDPFDRAKALSLDEIAEEANRMASQAGR